MKHYYFSFLCVLSSIIMCSCQSDESVPARYWGGDAKGLLGNGGQISAISLYCIEKYNSHVGEPHYEYNPRVKTLNNYSDFYLQLELYINPSLYFQSDDSVEMGMVGKYEEDYYKTKSQFMVEEYDKWKHETKRLIEWPVFASAYVNGEVSIVCNKMLFGEEPGTNLDKYFNVNRYYGVHDMFVENAGFNCLPIGIENPRMLYNFGEEIPHDMDKFFIKGTWLQSKYYLQFKELPTEKYDDLTLTVTFPMIREHVRDYAVAKYRGEAITKAKLTEDVFKADCQIKFEWE